MNKEILIQTIIFLFFSVPSSVCDARKFRIPLKFVLVGIFTFIAYHIYFLASKNLSYQYLLKNPLAAVLSSFIIFLCARVLSGNGLGKGDIIFGIFTALYTGFYRNIIAIAFSALIGMLFYLFCAVFEKFKKKHDESARAVHRIVFAIPFVPFITAGALLSKFLWKL